MHQKIAVIDYGMGNLHSIVKALKHVSPRDTIQVVRVASELREADRIVFPGDGAIRDCMSAIQKAGIAEVLANSINEKPFLGICIGMQVLYGLNEEHAGARGIDVVHGEVKKIPPKTKEGIRLKIPHMGWNNISYMPSPLWHNIEQDSRFYFLHSYYCATQDRRLSAASCDYGIEFDAAVHMNNIFAVQFHPEKSHKTGLQFLANFINWNGEEH